MSRTRSTGTYLGQLPMTVEGGKTQVKVNTYSPFTLEYRTLPYGTVASPVCSTLKTITDVVGFPKNYNPIVHEKYYPVDVLVPMCTVSTVNPPNWWFQYGVWYTISDSASGGFQASPEIHFPSNAYPYPAFPTIEWASMVSSVGDSVSGLMSTRTNILVTLAEIAKTIAMVKKPFKAIRSLPSVGITLKEVAKAGASGWLEYKYGWKQLYKDIASIATIIEKVDDHFRYLSDHLGQDRTLSAVQVDEVTPSATYQYNLGVVNVKFTAGVVSRTARFSCVQLIEESLLEISRSRAILKALGAGKMVEALWDIVPFSFVVDWFFHIDRIVSLNPAYWTLLRMRRLGYSIKHEWTYTPSCVTTVGTTWDGLTNTATWNGDPRVMKVRYERITGFPAGQSGAGAWGGLSKANLFDGACLIVQRL